MTGPRQGDDAGSPDPFAAFVTARMGALLSFAHLLTGDLVAAEDLVQSALARTAGAWWRVQRTDDPEGYVRRVIVRTQLNVWRARRWREQPVADVPDRPVWDDPIAAVDEREAMWQALRRLPPRQRAVLVLRYYNGQSEQQIASTLGCAPGTVKSQAAKGLATLRRLLADHQEVPS